MICDCSPPTAEEIEDGEVGCGDECLNRLLMIECGSRCPCGDACTNKRFQRRKYADVGAKVIFDSSINYRHSIKILFQIFQITYMKYTSKSLI